MASLIKKILRRRSDDAAGRHGSSRSANRQVRMKLASPGTPKVANGLAVATVTI